MLINGKSPRRGKGAMGGLVYRLVGPRGSEGLPEGTGCPPMGVRADASTFGPDLVCPSSSCYSLLSH